ncbi:aldehyde dehydrogenase family protein (plasmid) [Paraburkholderia sp. D15]|uniref:aldehyde dehydrogenase family protein n=1 Tax=Paraburkholderia sp. D15 TaxID=2880218 RepID=UPI0024788E2D|nr:aldehyde dehydrogenase family protein [Paraburkholderia sp. D15]WGS55150.1 aldehyde dehydrogenase family protein [Paraburkholderia sp. D15]
MLPTREARHWVAGTWLADGPRRESINPATGDVIGHFHDAPEETMQAAIDAAEQAFLRSPWRSDAHLRAAALSHLADAFEARLDEVIDTLCLENGKIRPEATFEASLIPRALRFAVGLSMHNFGRVLESRPGQQAMSIREPVGVAGLIVPWNSPAYLCIRALAPSLAAGCSAVIKMPHQAAQMAALLGRIIETVGEIPPGVINIVIESGAHGARRLVDSRQVPAISFTGSTSTGRAIARAAADRLKRVGLELGGKTPHLIFDDADLHAALPVLEKSCTVFAGQFCMTGSRILVHRDLAHALKEGLAARLREVRAGPARDASSQMGPLIDKAAVKRVDMAVEAAIAAGARVIVRGGPSADPALAGGAFYLPTLLEIDDPALPIAREETFGPVQTVQVFDTEDEAIAMANDSEYGLSACVWSRDVDRPIRVARRLHAGLISINSWANLAVEFEEGGFKASGTGRLGGLASVEDFLEYKQITQDFVPRAH